MNKDVQQLIERVSQFPGVRVDARSAHPRVYKDGVFVTALPSTPSKPSWRANAVAALKRGGIDINAVPEPVAKEPASATQIEPFRQPSLTELRAKDTAVRKQRRLEAARKGLEKAGLSLPEAEAEALRLEVKTFLTNHFDYPKRGGFSRFLGFAQGLVAAGRVEGFKNLNSASVSIGNFLNERNGISRKGADFLTEAMRAYRAGETFESQPKAPEAKPKKAKKQIKRTPASAPAQALPTPAQVGLVLANGALDAFMDLVEGRALTKAELMEALSLAEMNAEFTAAHPRS